MQWNSVNSNSGYEKTECVQGKKKNSQIKHCRNRWTRRSGEEVSQDMLWLGLKAFHGPCSITFTLSKGHKKIFGGKGVLCVLGEPPVSTSPEWEHLQSGWKNR